MAVSRRLVATFGFKARGAIPKVLYLGHDADEAKEAFEAAKDKGYWQLKVCRDIDAYFMHRWNAPEPQPVKVIP